MMDEPSAAGLILPHAPPAAYRGDGPGEGLPAPLRHLSPSSIATLMRCPEQFRRAYLLRAPAAPSGEMLMGTACHAAHEHNYRQKIDSHEDLPPQEVADVYDAMFEREVEERGAEAVWKAPRGKVKDNGAAMIEPYLRLGAASVQPSAVERWIDLRVDGVKVVGRVDVIGRVVTEVGGRPETVAERAVIDMKFGDKIANVLSPGDRLQGLIYALAEDAPAHFHYVSYAGKVTLPPDRPILVPWNVGAEQAARLIVRRAVATIRDLYGRYGPDEPWPSGLAHTWACSSCSHRPGCAYWGGAS